MRISYDEDVIDQIERAKARVTIVTPTFNRADLIEHTINSVLAQTYNDYIYIILDDGSTDGTKKIVRDLIKEKKNCFYLYHTNIGEAETVNSGWKLCKGEYFLQVNSDDTIEPTLLEEMVSALNMRPNAVVAYPDFYITNQEGKIVENFKNKDWNFIDALSAFSCYAAAPGALIRKSAFRHLDKIKDGKYRYINDIKMLWNMALAGDFIHVPKTLASWRSHSDGISTDRYRSIEEVLRWADEYFAQKDLPKEVKDIEQRCRQNINIYCLGLLEGSKTESVIISFTKHLNKDYQKLLGSIEQIKQDSKMLELQNRELLLRLDEIERSTSWKITKPLRYISWKLKMLLRNEAKS